MNQSDCFQYIVTLIARNAFFNQIQKISYAFTQQDVVIESEQLIADGANTGYVVVELQLSAKQDKFEQLRLVCLKQSEHFKIDMTVRPRSEHQHRLVCFDMDSTLIEQEVIDELAKEMGVGDQVAQITEQAMQGELDFQQSFRARVALLKGLDISVLEKISQRLVIQEGAQTLIKNLKAQGYRTAILSGGFQYFAEYLQEILGIDEVHANHLTVENGKVTGEVIGTIVDGERKAVLLQTIANNMQIDLSQVIAVGDGANDLPMLSLANLGVAYHAKPKVKAQAKQAISYMGLDAILYVIGFKDKNIQLS